MPQLDPLYIGEPNLVYCEIRDLAEAEVTGATVTFTVKTTAGVAVGTANVSMPYVAGRTRYEGTFPAADAATLTDGGEYEVHITASGYTLRVLERVAQYRGRN
jgi:hypothetical protein